MLVLKKVIAMRRNKRERQENALTLGELSLAIDQHRIPFARHGESYELRVVDVEKLPRLHANLPEILRHREIVTLDVGRSA